MFAGFHTGFFCWGWETFADKQMSLLGGVGVFHPGFIIIGHVMLDGSGGLPPGNFLKFRPSEITSGAFSFSK